MTAPRVAVIGAGIIGLATASELAVAGAEVRCYEKGAVGGAQSKGSTRIFRHAHGDPRLVALALRAGEGWRAWEDRFKRRLIGREGVIVTGAEMVPRWQRAMTDGGAPSRLLSEEECRELLPIGRLPAFPALFDAGGGSTRVHRIVEIMRLELGGRIHGNEVTAIESTEAGCVVRTAEGQWACDEVVICAGIDTSALAASVDLDLPVTVKLHSRFTFAIAEPYLGRHLSCWIDDSGSIGNGLHSYGQPVGNTGRYAVGVEWAGQRCTLDVGAEAVSRESRGAAKLYVSEALPGLNPEPVDEIRCSFNEYTFLQRGDGFLARRRDRVTAFYGNNLFKFAPLLGALLAQSAMRGEVPSELEDYLPV